MYKVMLADDDYPVIELLEQTVPWDALGLSLVGSFENGVAALEAAEKNMPDILVTDIGMPKLDGLELIGRMKASKPSLRVVILSCHSEFEYAQRAMQLQVQDYVVKDTLQPEDLVQILVRMVGSLKEERRLHLEQHRLRHLIHQSRDALREKWAQSAVQQPLLQEEPWVRELESFGLPAKGRVIVPIIGFIGAPRKARSLFVSEDNLRFAVTNVMDDVVREHTTDAVCLPYRGSEWFILCSFPSTTRISCYGETRRLLEHMQWALRRMLKLSVSFVMGERCSDSRQMKQEMRTVAAHDLQRFYMGPAEIAMYRTMEWGKDIDIFANYDEAMESLLECVVGGDEVRLTNRMTEWMQWIRREKFAPEAVKDWALKLLLDIRLKQQTIFPFQVGPSLRSLHKELGELGSLYELQEWLEGRLLQITDVFKESDRGSVRREVQEAYAYVSLHLDRRIGLEDIADHLHLNASYFSRLFKKETGETFIEYVTRRKVERAKELLDQTAHPVAKISELLGYENPSYFIRLFKNAAGMTPAEYRHRGMEARSQ